MNIAQTRQRAAAGIIAAALLVSACGGGDTSSTANEAPLASQAATETLTDPTPQDSSEAATEDSSEVSTETLTEYDLVRVSPANRQAITEELEASAMFHVWDGSKLTVLSSDEATVEDFIDTLIAADAPAAGGDAGGGAGVKNNAIASWFNKTTKSAADLYKGGAKGYEDWSQKNIKRISKEYRNASGEVVDGAGNLVKWLPKEWPKNLEAKFLKEVVLAAEQQLNSAIDQLGQEGRTLKNMSAGDAEKRINNVLSGYKVEFPKMTLFAGRTFTDRSSYVPVPAPITVKIKRDQWTNANGMNLQLNIDFIGITEYRVQFGCLGFPNGWTAAPTFTFNGGCDNPWNLMASPDMVAAAAKKIAGQAGRELESMSEEILAVLTSVAKEADNPRIIPPLLLDLPINEFLGWCCSLSYPSSETAETPDAGKPPKKDGTKEADKPDEDPGDDVMAEAIGNMAKDAALVFTVSELAGISFEFSPDLSLVAVFDDRWTSDGQMEFAVQLGFFGIFSATVNMGCVTFGTSWSQEPTFTFEGGCDKSWGVDFSAPGYTTSSQRLDKRTGR